MAYVNFSNQFLDEIRARISVSEVVGRKVKLTRKGKEFQGLCPFHNEKTPSFTVNDQKGFYHCFGCGAHGDAVRFLTDAEGVPFPEAVEQMARKAGLAMPQATPEQARKQQKQATLADVVAIAAAWFEQHLKQRPPRVLTDYLGKRGLDGSLQQHFKLGYAPDSYEALQQHLKQQNVPISLMKAAGLVSSSDRGDYDKFRHRLMFPIADNRGRIIAFGGRVLGDAKPKYLNSPETELFKKGELLYNYHHAKGKAYDAKRIVVAEGYMDVIALHRAGIEESVAPLGTAVTESQLALLWKCADEPIFCLDGDNAGRRAMERAAMLALPMITPGKSLRFTLLPKGMDPDDILKSEGSNALKNEISNAKPLSDIIWQLELQREPLTTPEQKANLEQRLHEIEERITHAGVKNQYRMFFREKMWKQNQKARSKSSKKEQTNPIREPSSGLEEDILAIIIAFPALLQDEALNESLYSVEFSSKILDKIRLFALEECAVCVITTDELQEMMQKAGFAKPFEHLQALRQSVGSATVKLTQEDAKSRLEYNLAKLHLLHLKEEQQHIRSEFTEESEARAEAFQEEINRWSLHIQQLELQDF